MSSAEKKLIVILEQAPLEVGKVNGAYRLLQSDKHAGFIKKHGGKDLYRPDIAHQCLLNLMDSPLNQAGRLQVYLKTTKNVLIYIHPQCRIPRSFHRFSGLMVQLLKNLKIRSPDGKMVLLKVVANPIQKHLPVGCHIVGLEKKDEVVKLWEYVPKAVKNEGKERDVAFVVGSMAKGDLEIDYCDDIVSISRYGLSAALTCAKLTSAFEEYWSVL